LCLRINNLLLSCRVLGRNIEKVILGHLILAHIKVLREKTSLEEYESYVGPDELPGFPNSPYDACLAMRFLSKEDDEDVFELLSARLTPQLFANVASAYEVDRNNLLSKHLGSYCRFIAKAHGFKNCNPLLEGLPIEWGSRSGNTDGVAGTKRLGFDEALFHRRNSSITER